MTCQKKVYTTRGAAIRAAMHSSKRAGIGLRIYACRTCKGFHLTKQRKA